MDEKKFALRRDNSTAAPDTPNYDSLAENSKGTPVPDQSATKPEETQARTQETERNINNLHYAMAAPKPAAVQTSINRSESTELERRTLAHERILQVLIAHVAETEPKLLVRLIDTFCVPMQMAHREHDYTDTDSYAEEFIRTVIRLGDKSARKLPSIVKVHQLDEIPPSGDIGDEMPLSAPARFRINHMSGVWRVTKDGRFHGDYFKEEYALRAVERGS